MFYKGFIISFNNFTLMMFIFLFTQKSKRNFPKNTVRKSLMQAPRDSSLYNWDYVKWWEVGLNARYDSWFRTLVENTKRFANFNNYDVSV